MYQYDAKCWTEVVDAEIRQNAMSKFQQNDGVDDDKNHDEFQINNTHCGQMANLSEKENIALSLKKYLCGGNAMAQKQLRVNLSHKCVA